MPSAISIQIEKFVKNQQSIVTPPSEQLYVTLLQETFSPSFGTICVTVLEKKSKIAKNMQKFLKK